MALALYRKYRPAKLADVVGQEHVTEPLATALTAGRINHAYLFSGPRGCGKTSSARILARSLNCEQGPTPDPCGVCNSCIALAPEGSGSIDVVELDAASHGGVEDARELRDRAFYAPAESRYRVFVVDEAHMVTTQGFNALLKIVEEPPEHLVFVFATTEPEKVLPTIRSRTHHYPFRLIPPGTMRSLLEKICGEEQVTVAPPVFPLVIRAGGGSARDTLSVLDQLLAGAGPQGVTYERAVALLGVTDSGLIDDTVDALAAADGAAVYGAVDRLVEAGHDPRRFASDLLQRFRDLMLVQAVPDAAEQGLVDGAEDELARMADQAARLGPATLTRYGEILHQGLIEMRGATAPRLLLELLVARMLLPAATTSDGGLLERLERIERRNAIAPDPAGPSDDGAAKRFVRPSERPPAPTSDGAAPGAGGGAPARSAERDAGAPAAVPAPAPARPDEPAPRPAVTRAADVPRSAERDDEDGSAATPAAGPAAPARSGDRAEADPRSAERAPASVPDAPVPDVPVPDVPVPDDSVPDASVPAVSAPAESDPVAPGAGDGPVPADGPAADAPATGTGHTDGEPARQADGPGDGARRADDPGPGGAGAEDIEEPAAQAAPSRSPAPPRDGAPPDAVPPESAQPVSSASSLDATAVRRVWPEILAAVRQRSRSTEALLVNATVRAVDGDTLVLAIGAPPLARRLSEARNTDVIADALRAVLGVQWRVHCDTGEAATARRAAAPDRAQRAVPQRPSQRDAPQREQGGRPARRPAGDSDVPLPPEPPPEDAPPDPRDAGPQGGDGPGARPAPVRNQAAEEEDMLAEAAAEAASPGARRDPEAAALEILTSHLGARKLDPR
ncbi:DNA polymerase III subunits gamma and tau [Pseudonocardia sp. Ae406_Ps2]|uniref:DNA polymerase III subunit gamma and tau n=1 Tax=unclassified Pseudonocardia TaxID=2619320 RepID=UPI0009601F55|nr:MULTISPECIES: DNA polymerase III subunit gamma and tau [unclassified Pseudonocardia]OLL98831.1 DNA polymerase III subunits gamma and tau [Pseudonocardia sp. Ae331_Ps2]OLM03429.1 DNA polymerase III subunits gamma and tau [Pseudonocardia sp. Ae406_Ps2]OLM24988.1 DNA polymerase III subunits gamma and tau [Pseudonocardia sp. Ae706_Ps2]OLM34780.1 DNA polymerase III subunits gamma and tau [Pseudonocardia sp. Ae717_Ps2]